MTSRACAVAGAMKDAAAKIVTTGSATWRDDLRIVPLLISRIDNDIFMFSIRPARISLPSACGNSITNHRADRRGERYCRSDWLVFSSQTRGSQFQGALPVPSGENRVVPCESAAANLPLLRMWGGRERVPLCDGLRAPRFSFRSAQACDACWHPGN